VLSSAVIERSEKSVRAGFALTVVTFWITLVLGGASIAGFATDAGAELAALPLLAAALIRLAAVPATRLSQVRVPLVLLAALLLLPLLQLVPLPPGLWTNLPGRGFVAETFALIGEARPWWPPSLDPPATLRAFLSLLPAAAIFLALLTTGLRERRILTLLLAAFAVFTVFLGLAQLAQGEDSPLRLYTITNRDSSVGFFANRNHHAAFLCAVLPLVLAWTVHVAGKRRSDGQVLSVVYALAAILLLLGAAMTLSRAGILLATLALGSGALFLDFQSARGSRASSGRLMVVIGLIALVMIANYALSGLIMRFGTAGGDDFRFAIWSITREAAWSVFPVGGGFGTFQPLYRLFDRPEALTDAYVNRAHNDWLELVLEAGLPALILMAVFLVWLVLASVRVWTRRTTAETRLDTMLARAATIGIALFLAHSVVDYPLRTIAAQATFACLCALLVPPLCERESPARRRGRGTRNAAGSHRDRAEREGGSVLPGSEPSSPPSPPRDRRSLNWTE